MNNLPVGPAVPAAAAEFFSHAGNVAVVMQAVWKAISVAEKAGPDEAGECKRFAYSCACNDFDLHRQVLGQHPDVDQYVLNSLIPALIDGLILAANAALWFVTQKIIEVGGQNNPAPQPAIARVPTGPPPVQPDPGGAA